MKNKLRISLGCVIIGTNALVLTEENLMGEVMQFFSFEELKKMIQQFSSCIDGYLYVWDIQNDCYYIDEKSLERFLVPVNSFQNVRKVHEEFVYSEDFPVLVEDLDRVAKGEKQRHNIRYRWLDKEKQPVWINCRGSVINDAEDKPRFMIGAINEIGKKPKADNVSGLLETTAIADFLDNFTYACPDGFVLRIGIDDFKDINEKFGIEYGDYILKGVANCIVEAIRPGQEAYRVVSDEFMVVDFVGGKPSEANKVYRNICSAIDSFIENNNYEAVFTISCGILYSKDITNPSYNELLKLSQYALSEAKNRGKNQSYLFETKDYEKFIKKRTILRELRESVGNGCRGFELNFQPITEAVSEKTYAAEALLRFTTSYGEKISPMEFVPILEGSGLIIPVGRWILQEATSMCKSCQEYDPDFKISINLSYIQMRKSPVLTDIFNVISKYHLKPDSIIIEMTESGNLENTPAIRRMWNNLREFGVLIAIDDFGTGYSNLQSISNLGPNIVKLDRDFTVKALKNDYENQLMSHIIELVHSIDLKICIEGVEKKTDLDKMKQLRPDYIQGYYYGKPCGKEEFIEKFLK